MMEEKSIPAGLKRSWAPYCVLGVALGVTLVFARGVGRITQVAEQAKFRAAAERTTDQFQRMIQGHLTLLDGLRGLTSAKLSLGFGQFQAYVDALRLRQNYPGVQGMGFAVRMVQGNKEKSLKKLRELNPSFRIWPDSDLPELYPVMYLAPADSRNTAEIGHDLYLDPLKRSAMERAAETALPSASPNFVAMPGAAGGKGAGILLLAPAYWTGMAPATRAERAHMLNGFVFCSFYLEDLFKVVSDTQRTPGISFRVYDGALPDAEHLLYDSMPEDDRTNALRPTLSRTLSVADRTWTVVFSKRQEFAKGAGKNFNPFFLFFGTVISFLAFGIALTRTKARAALAQHAEAQRLADARFRRLVEQSLVGIYVIQNDRFVYVNPKMAAIFGCPEEELTSRPLFDFITEDSRSIVKENLEKRLKGEVESIHYTLRAIDKAGKVMDVEAHGGRADYSGQPAIMGCLMDITERKQSERKLGEQLERLNLLQQITRAIGERLDLPSIFQVVIRSLEDHLPIDFSCICLHDQTENALTVARVGARSQGLALEMALTEQARFEIDKNGLSRCVQGELVYEPDVSVVEFPFPQRLARGGLRSLVAAPLVVESNVFGALIAARRSPEAFSSGECEFLRQLSEHVALAMHQAQLYGALHDAYDELRQTQQVVMQQDRLSALGQMASGIAHDINNAISPVALYTESLLEREPNLSERARGYLTTIQRAIEDVAETVSRMREFYRQREPQLTLTPVDLNRLAQQVADLTRARWSDMPQQRGCMIEMRMELAPDLPAVPGVESEIREAITNLIFNAVDAMPDGGTLTLRTIAVDRPPPSEEKPETRHVHLEVADTGVGMPEEIRRHCMDPFFTTKGERGTGLGMAMVYGMAQRHGAEMEIDSAPGTGTTIRLIFPASSMAAPEAVCDSAPLRPQGRLRLLIVDDDPLLIQSLRDTLSSDGHAVTSADGGQEGIDAFLAAEQRSEPFAAVITDLGMPYVDGRKVSAAVKAASPTTPVILLTGWGKRLVAEGDVPPGVDCVLSKPPKLRELREALARLTANNTSVPPW